MFRICCFILMVALAPLASAQATYYTNTDNENNANTHVADNDMDVSLGNASGIHPIEFNIDVATLPMSSAAITIRALDVDEEPAVDVINKMGSDYFVVSSDYPHSDGAFPEAVSQFMSLPLTDEQRRKILWDNCARLYGVERPAAALTREVSAAA